MPQIETTPRDGRPDDGPNRRRPGELAFALLLLLASLGLLHSAYGISGFQALSAPGSVPMATTSVMAVTALIVVWRTARRPRGTHETLGRDILPARVILFAGLLVAYGLLLKPLGFLPTSALFLVISIKTLARRGWGWTLAVSLGSLALIWLIFRIAFTVLMPAGIVPEAELIQLFRDLLPGGAG